MSKKDQYEYDELGYRIESENVAANNLSQIKDALGDDGYEKLMQIARQAGSMTPKVVVETVLYDLVRKPQCRDEFDQAEVAVKGEISIEHFVKDKQKLIEFLDSQIYAEVGSRSTESKKGK